MKRVANLMPDVVALSNLLCAYKQAARGKRQQPEVAWFEFHRERQLLQIQQLLSTNNASTYQPGAYRLFMVKDPKPRNICAPQFTDRVIHHAICNVLEPVFEKRYIEDSWACRKNKGSHQAIRRAQYFAQKNHYYLQMDIARFFDSVDHQVLRKLLRKVIKDKALLALLDVIIEHNPPDAKQGKSLPIGNLTSQYFANLYLGELDHFIKSELRVKAYLRYMDDFVLFAQDKQTLHSWQYKIETFLHSKLLLHLKQSATTLAPVSSGLRFLGFNIFPNLLRLTNKTKRRFIRRKNHLFKQLRQGVASEKQVQLKIQSMLAHISQANSTNLQQKLFGL